MHHTKHVGCRSFAIGSACLPAIALLAASARAATIDWSGTVSSTWATSANWVGGLAPANSTSTDIARFNFATAPAFAPNVGTRSIGGLVIGDGVTAVSAFTLTGTKLTLGAAGIVKYAGSLATTVATPVTLAASQSWTNQSATLLNVTGTVAGGAHSLTLAGSGDITLAADLGGTGSLIKTGAGTLRLVGINGFTGGIFLRGGILEAGGSGKKETLGSESTVLTFDGADATLRLASAISNSLRGYVFTQTGTIDTNGFDLSLRGPLSGFGGLIKTGAGKLTLDTVAAYAGPTTLSAGSLELGSSGGLVSGSAVSIANVVGATFALRANQTLGALSGGGAAGGVLDIASTTLTVGAGGATSTWSGTLVGAPGSRLNKVGAGAFTLASLVANENYSGDFGVSGGTLRFLAAGALGKANFNHTIRLSQGGILEAGASVTLGSHAITLGSADANGVAGNFHAGAGVVAQLQAAIVNEPGVPVAGGLTKTGEGTLVLAAANTYTGLTTLSAGTLVLNGSLAGDLVVESGATLAGTGLIAGDVQLAGTHAPGNSIGIQTVQGDLAYASGANLVWELGANLDVNGPVVGFDQVVVGSNLTFAGPATLLLGFNPSGGSVDWTNGFWDSQRRWVLFDVAGSTTNAGNLAFVAFDWMDANGLAFGNERPDASFALVRNGSDLELHYAPIPEPTVAGLINAVLAIAFAIFRRRRQLTPAT